jgi:hypothetical protein
MQDKQVLGARADSFDAHHQKLANNAAEAVADVSLDDQEDKPVVAAESSQRQGLFRPQQLVGKLSSLGWLNIVTSGQLIHMLDQNSKRRFLVDTGASCSILTHQSSLPAKGPKLFGPAPQEDCLVHLRFQG